VTVIVPTTIIFLLFLVAFCMAVWQYYQIDPRRRIFNQRFGVMAGCIVAMLFYVLRINAYPDDWRMSWIFLGLGVGALAYARFLSRRMPPREL
jgi:uncharacterized membrane protein YccC